MPSFMPSRGERTVDRLAAEQDGSRSRRLDAEQREPDIGAPRADQAGEAEHLAAMQIEADALEHAPATQALHREEQGPAGPMLAAPLVISISRPTMSAIARCGVASARGRVEINRPSRKTVILSAISNTSSMRWLTNRIATPWLFRSRTSRNSSCDLVRGERRGRLVHDEDANVQRDRLGDFHRLLRGQREAARRAAHVERDAELGEDRLGLAEHLPPADHGAAILMADENVLGDVQIGKQQRFLIDRRDAHALRLGGARDRDRPPCQQDLATVGLMDAGDDLDQRRLAGAVLAQQRVDFAGMERERDVVEGLCRVEALGDAADIQNGLAVGRLPFTHGQTRGVHDPNGRICTTALSASACNVDDRSGHVRRRVAQ